jgi:hypothetical protein
MGAGHSGRSDGICTRYCRGPRLWCYALRAPAFEGRAVKLPRPTQNKKNRTQTNASDAPFEDRHEVMEDCGMGRGVHRLKKGPTRKTSEKEEETTKGVQDAWSPESDATPAPVQLGRH